MSNTYVLVDIGCLECQENTVILGVWKKDTDALSAFRCVSAKHPDGSLYGADSDGTRRLGLLYYSGLRAVEMHCISM